MRKEKVFRWARVVLILAIVLAIPPASAAYHGYVAAVWDVISEADLQQMIDDACNHEPCACTPVDGCECDLTVLASNRVIHFNLAVTGNNHNFRENLWNHFNARVPAAARLYFGNVSIYFISGTGAGGGTHFTASQVRRHANGDIDLYGVGMTQDGQRFTRMLLRPTGATLSRPTANGTGSTNAGFHTQGNVFVDGWLNTSFVPAP